MGGGARGAQIVASWFKKQVANAKAVFRLFVCIHRLLLSFVFPLFSAFDLWRLLTFKLKSKFSAAFLSSYRFMCGDCYNFSQNLKLNL